jgi:hypothetical protein
MDGLKDSRTSNQLTTKKEAIMEPLEFDQILYNEPIYWLEQKWQRKLNDHEKHLAILIYRWTRTTQEAEEIKILEAR